MPPRRSTRGTTSYPTAPQIRDAYSQFPLQFGKQSFPTPKSKSKFPSSASGSNCTPLSTPEEVEARRQASNAWKLGRAPGKFIDVGGFKVPAPPLAEIEGREVGDNKKLAEGLKMMLEDDDQGMEMEEMNQVSTTSKQTPSRYQYERKALSKAFQQEYSLPHEKRSRSDIIAGQEVGLGVIGSTHTALHAVTAEGKEYMAKVVEGEHGCDTPLYTFEDARRGIAIPEGCLNPDLPPLAIEHPARMWNSLIHSLEPGLQPVVKWDYERSTGGGYIANFTLALPPTHPSISTHPLAITVPKNTNSKEYIAVLELLGGVRRYKGEPRKLKAEAQNCALVKCIADDAISWIYAPVTKGHMDAGKDDEVVEEGVAEREGIENEGAGIEMDSDEIVIDIDDEMEDVAEPASKAEEQDQAYIEIEAFDADAFQESYDTDHVHITHDVDRANVESVENDCSLGVTGSRASS